MTRHTLPNTEVNGVTPIETGVCRLTIVNPEVPTHHGRKSTSETGDIPTVE